MRFPNKKPKQFQVIVKEWFDKVNGNSYFSARLYKNGVLIKSFPLQYGYGSQFEFEAICYLKLKFPSMHKFSAYELFTVSDIHTNCLKKDCVSWGE